MPPPTEHIRDPIQRCYESEDLYWENAGDSISRHHRTRNCRRKQLRSMLHDGQKVVDGLQQVKKGPVPEEVHASAPVSTKPTTHIKRYRNE